MRSARPASRSASHRRPVLGASQLGHLHCNERRHAAAPRPVRASRRRALVNARLPCGPVRRCACRRLPARAAINRRRCSSVGSPRMPRPLSSSWAKTWRSTRRCAPSQPRDETQLRRYAAGRRPGAPDASCHLMPTVRHCRCPQSLVENKAFRPLLNQCEDARLLAEDYVASRYDACLQRLALLMVRACVGAWASRRGTQAAYRPPTRSRGASLESTLATRPLPAAAPAGRSDSAQTRGRSADVRPPARDGGALPRVPARGHARHGARVLHRRGGAGGGAGGAHRRRPRARAHRQRPQGVAAARFAQELLQGRVRLDHCTPRPLRVARWCSRWAKTSARRPTRAP